MNPANPGSTKPGIALTCESDDEKLRALRTLVVDCPELRQLERRLGPFNIFDVLKSAHNEIRHSNVLAWLLDPRGSHRMRDLFLRRFLMLVFHKSGQEHASYLDPVKIDTTPIRAADVLREWNRVDVLVEIVTDTGEQWVVSIENKIWAWQSAGQLATYRDRVERAFPDAAHRVYIFLTVRAEKPDDAEYTVATFSQVSSALETCLAEQGGSLGEGPRLLIEHYLLILRERFMENAEVRKLAQNIYATHRLALDTIFAYRPDGLSHATTELEQRIKADAAKLSLRHKYTGKGWIGFTPLCWEVAENKLSQTWSTVLCEITLTSDRLILKAFANPNAPFAWRERLCTLAQHFPNTTHKKTAPDGRLTFYRLRGAEIKLGEAESSEIGDLADMMWTWIKTALSSESFVQMVTVVAEHLKTLPKTTEVSAP
jgi:PD-(D/E)XK nuclease superfamily protein